VATDRTAETIIRRAATIFRTQREQNSPHRRHSKHSLVGNLSTSASSHPSSPPRRSTSSYIIQCYSPTSDAEKEKKYDFYQQLQAVIHERDTRT
jgi:hypothetical protein